MINKPNIVEVFQIKLCGWNGKYNLSDILLIVMTYFDWF